MAVVDHEDVEVLDVHDHAYHHIHPEMTFSVLATLQFHQVLNRHHAHSYHFSSSF